MRAERPVKYPDMLNVHWDKTDLTVFDNGMAIYANEEGRVDIIERVQSVNFCRKKRTR